MEPGGEERVEGREKRGEEEGSGVGGANSDGFVRNDFFVSLGHTILILHCFGPE